MIRKPIRAPYALASGYILVRLELDDFLDLTLQNGFTILHGHSQSRWRGAPTGHYYFATDGRITYYLRTEEPVKQIDPDIEAADIRIQLYPSQQIPYG
jgi:hypothetical protein